MRIAVILSAMFLVFLDSFLGSSLGAAEKLVAKDGRSIGYDTIEFEPKTPKTAILLRTGSSLTTLKLSEIEASELPQAQRDALAEFTKGKKLDGLILFDDEWINRDEHLLKLDKRFTYDKKIHRSGKNVLKVVNPGTTRVTLGLRSGGKGLEFSVEPGKTKSLGGLTDGDYSFYFVFETEGDQALEVHESDKIGFKNVEYTLTMAPTADNGIPTKPAGRIEIPKEMRRE